MTATSVRSGCSIWCATRSAWCRRSAIAASTRWSGMISAASVAAWCALVRPDVFRSVVLMSAPFAGPPPLPFNTADAPPRPKREDPVHRELAALPRPRKHYQWYYSTREANADMHRAPQGVHDFLRAYYHHKSADWKDNQPYPLKSWTASELAKLPTYYVMDLARNMAETVAEEMPSAGSIAANRWLPDSELVFLQRRIRPHRIPGRAAMVSLRHLGRVHAPNSQTWSGRSIDVPSCFISGKQDWGTYQRPGVYEAMQQRACTRDARLSPGRWRRPLGAAGTAGPGQPACCCDFLKRSAPNTRPSRVPGFSEGLSQRERMADAGRCRLPAMRSAPLTGGEIWKRRSLDFWER